MLVEEDVVNRFVTVVRGIGRVLLEPVCSPAKSVVFHPGDGANDLGPLIEFILVDPV